MNQRDQNRGGRGGRYGSMRGEEGERYGDDRERDQEREEREHAHRSWTERLAAGYRDTYNPEPQWLREDRERAGGGDNERDTWGRGGTYTGAGREREEQRGEFGQRYGSGASRESGYDNAYGGSQRDVESFHPADERGWSEREERQGFSAGARRNRPFSERERYRGALWRDQTRNEPDQGAPRGRSSYHDLSTGFEPARWTDDDFNRAGYGGFRVGTGMGLASDDYMRPTFGRSYGEASGYGSRSGWDLGTHQRDTGGRSFRGMGPQSYKRPDERIRDDVYERLTDSHHIDARNIMVEVNQGNVTLNGTVGERRMRYMAEDLVEGVMGVVNINNQLKVQSESKPPSTDTPTGEQPDNKRH